MLIGAEEFLSQVDLRRFVCITGWKGAGKDLLTQELVEYYLRRRSRRYKVHYHLITNQQCVWSDYVPGQDVDMKASVFWLSEAGMYLRKMSDFRLMYSMARKLDQYFFFPSIEVPHAVLTSFICEPVGKWQNIFGLWWCPLWAWRVSSTIGSSYGGQFYFLPSASSIGVYDTEDLSDDLELVVGAYEEKVREYQRERGRSNYKLSEVADGEADDAAQWTFLQEYAKIALSIQERKKG